MKLFMHLSRLREKLKNSFLNPLHSRTFLAEEREREREYTVRKGVEEKFLAHSPIRVGLKIVVAIAGIEFVIMLVLWWLSAETSMPLYLFPLIDTLTLAIAASIVVIYWVVNPMNRYYQVRLQTAETLHKKEEHHRAVVESIFKFIPEGVLVLTESLKLLKHNKAFDDIVQKYASLLGYAEQELTENIVVQCRTKIEHGDSKEIYIPGKYQSRTDLSQSDKLILEFNTARMFLAEEEEEEEEASIVVSLLDVTERKRAEEEQRKSEVKYELLINQMNDGLLVVDNNDAIQFVNEKLCTMFGYKQEELIRNIGYSMLLPEESWDILQEKSLERIQGISEQYEIEMKKKSGERFFVSVSASPIYDPKGEVIGSMAILSDITERKRTEQEMRLSEERYRTIVESAHDIIWTMDTQGNFTFSNGRGEEITGHKFSDWVGKSFIPVIFPEDLPKVQELLLQVLQGIPQAFDVRVYDTRNNILTISVNTVPIFQDGIVVGTVSFGQDITERKRAEDELKESEERFRSVAQSANEAIITTDSTGIIVDWNRGAEKIFGYSEAEITGKDLTIIIPQNFVEKHISGMKRIEQGGEHHIIGKTVELYGLHKSGKEFPLELSLAQWEASSGKFFTGIIRDITEHRRAEQEIISQKNRFAQLFENSPIAIALLDDQDKIVHINESFSTLFGYFLEEIKGQDLDNIIVPTELKKEAKNYSDQTRGGNQINKESYRRRRDDTLVYVQIVGVPVIVNEKTVGIYGMYVDLTQRKDAEEKMKSAKELAEQSNKLKSEFLAQMSHEIRTPLNIMLGNVDYLNRSFSEKMDSDVRYCFDGIDLASKRIIRTVDLVLNVADLQTSGYKPNFIMIDLNAEILNKLYLEHQLSAKQKGLELIYKCELRETKALTDEYSVTQIFTNLIDNAINYTKKGKVEILLGKNRAGNIMVEIKDTGIGMSKEFLPRMFEPFVQEDHGYTRSYDGSGLGLALVKKYCDINNAIIEVESEKNVGTTFRVVFTKRGL